MFQIFFSKRNSYNFKQLQINSNIDNIENHLIDKFCEKNSYNICKLMFNKIGIADEIERIKYFLIDRTKTHFYDDIEIVDGDIEFDKEALNIFKKYGKLENYIETLTSNSTENNNFNSKIFKQITQPKRNIKKQQSKLTPSNFTYDESAEARGR